MKELFLEEKEDRSMIDREIINIIINQSSPRTTILLTTSLLLASNYYLPGTVSVFSNPLVYICSCHIGA